MSNQLELLRMICSEVDGFNVEHYSDGTGVWACIVVGCAADAMYCAATFTGEAVLHGYDAYDTMMLFKNATLVPADNTMAIVFAVRWT